MRPCLLNCLLVAFSAALSAHSEAPWLPARPANTGSLPPAHRSHLSSEKALTDVTLLLPEGEKDPGAACTLRSDARQMLGRPPCSSA